MSDEKSQCERLRHIDALTVSIDKARTLVRVAMNREEVESNLVADMITDALEHLDTCQTKISEMRVAALSDSLE